MTIDVSKECADYLRAQYLNQTGNKLKASHAHELVAAFFGYKSRAALRADKANPLRDLKYAKVLAPNIALLEERRGCLAGLQQDLSTSRSMAIDIAEFLEEQGTFTGEVWICESLTDYIREQYLRDKDALITDLLSGVMAETNAYFDETYYETAELVDSDGHLTIEVDGQLNGQSDDERPFCGDQIDMKVTVELPLIAGRVAFGEPDISATGEINDDWVDPELKFGTAIQE
jgi:hypothetical protein